MVFGNFDVDIAEVIDVRRSVYDKRLKSDEIRLQQDVCGFMCCVEGAGDIRLDGTNTPILLKPGQMIFLPANSVYTLCAPQNDRFRYFAIRFSLAKVSYEDGSMIAGIFTGKKVYTSSFCVSPMFRGILDRLLSVWNTKHSGYTVLAKAMVYELMYEYFSDIGQSHAITDNYRKLIPAKTVLDQEYAKEYSIKELSELCGFSETHFRRLFTSTFGVSPLAYRIGKQIEAAKDLLMSGEYSVGAVAEAVGFVDANYFSRMFRKQTGMSPGTFASMNAVVQIQR